MNERIRQLAEQAREFATTRHPVSNIVLSVNSEKFEEKFAELIVRECMSNLYLNGYDDAVIQIQKHFGVEDRAVPILSADEQALFAGITSSKLFTIAGAKKHFGVEE
jgi:hypothetical protein